MSSIVPSIRLTYDLSNDSIYIYIYIELYPLDLISC